MFRNGPAPLHCSILPARFEKSAPDALYAVRSRFPARAAAEQDSGAAIFGDVAVNLMHRSQDRFNAASDALFEPPLASVVVVNYNYGHLLRQAVTSILNQT